MDAEFESHLIDNLRIGVVLLDSAGRVLSWNSWMSRHSGIETSDAAGRRIDEIFPDMANSRLSDVIEQALRFKLSSMMAPGLNPGLPLYQRPEDRQQDRRMQQLIYVTPLRQITCACLLQIHDMTATVRRERRLRAQSSRLIETSFRDPLTGVGNRRRFDQDLVVLFAQAQQQQRPIAMLMIDVDDFKAYNDHFGHLEGDACLTKVATALRETLRHEGDCVTRYGGEEFALLLPNTPRAQACAIAERLRYAIEKLAIPHPTARELRQVTVSIGVTAMIPTTDQLCYILAAQADLALYAAKEKGRNRCLWYDQGTGLTSSCL